MTGNCGRTGAGVHDVIDVAVRGDVVGVLIGLTLGRVLVPAPDLDLHLQRLAVQQLRVTDLQDAHCVAHCGQLFVTNLGGDRIGVADVD